MNYFKNIKEYLNELNSYTELKNDYFQVKQETNKLGKFTDDYIKFTNKNSKFISKLNEIYNGLKDYYTACYENAEIRNKLKLTEGDVVRLHSLVRSAYSEERYQLIYSNLDTKKSTAARDTLSQYLTDKNNPQLWRYCKNIKTMLKTEHFAEDRIFSDLEKSAFEHKKHKLEKLFAKIKKQEELLNKLNEKVNKKVMEYLLKHRHLSYEELKQYLLETNLNGLENICDYQAINALNNPEQFKDKLRRDIHRKESIIVL